MKEIVLNIIAAGIDLDNTNVPKPVNPNNLVNGIINFVIGVLGVVAVGFIIYGGIQYSMSAGDSSKVTKAKNTILYAVIGLIVAVMAFAIVNFVVAGMQTP